MSNYYSQSTLCYGTTLPQYATTLHTNQIRMNDMWMTACMLISINSMVTSLYATNVMHACMDEGDGNVASL